MKFDTAIDSLNPGDIGLYNHDAITLAPTFLEAAQQANTFTFALLDPWGPTGIPYSFVKSFVDANRTDVMIYWPWNDLEKKTGMVTKESLTTSEIRLLDNYDRMFPGKSWRGIVEAVGDYGDLQRVLVEEYVRVLGNMSWGTFVKLIPMEFQDANRTLYYLFLTTHHPDGALKLNEVLDNARVSQQALKVFRRADREIQRQQTQPMFDLAAYDSASASMAEVGRQIDLEKLAEDILANWRGQRPRVAEIKGLLANSDVYAGDVLVALRRLRGRGLADWEGGNLNNRTVVRFDEFAGKV